MDAVVNKNTLPEAIQTFSIYVYEIVQTNLIFNSFQRYIFALN